VTSESEHEMGDRGPHNKDNLLFRRRPHRSPTYARRLEERPTNCAWSQPTSDNGTTGYTPP